jgi:RNA polymerase sigma factor (sigma-70 family)
LKDPFFPEKKKKKIIRALEQLDPDCRLLFKMKYVKGITLRTIAENLGIRENTVKKRHERCKKKLKQIFGRDPRIE